MRTVRDFNSFNFRIFYLLGQLKEDVPLPIPETAKENVSTEKKDAKQKLIKNEDPVILPKERLFKITALSKEQQMEINFGEIAISENLWRDIHSQVTELLDEIIEVENSKRVIDRPKHLKQTQDKLFTIIKVLAFAMTESGPEFDNDKFDLIFYHIRDELIEAIKGDRKTVETFHSMFTDQGVCQKNSLLLYCLKKFHLFRLKIKAKRKT